MTREDIQRIWLVCGTAFLAFVDTVAIVLVIHENGGSSPGVLLVFVSFALLVFNIGLLSSAKNSSRPLLCIGKILLWLGTLSLAGAVVWGILDMMGAI